MFIVDKHFNGSPHAAGTPKVTITQSPMNLSTVPSLDSIMEFIISKHSFISEVTSSALIFSDIDVKPEISAKRMVAILSSDSLFFIVGIRKGYSR